MSASIRALIVNYNAGDALLRSVASVLAEREALHLVVVDNASSDGSCEKLRNRFTRNERLEILENGYNAGFAPAVNACARRASEPYLLILNPDCELHPGALSALRAALERDDGAALAAPRVVDRNGKVLSGTLRSFPEPRKALLTASGLWRLGRWLPALRGVEVAAPDLPAETSRAEAVSGACMLLRSAVFQRLGGFDEGFRLHFEDLDLMYRLQALGLHCLYVPGASAFHQPGTSSRSRRWWVHRQKHLGMLRFFDKHYACRYPRPLRWSMWLATWLHWGASLPLVWLRR